jgi:hypothetical protein
MRDAKLEAEMDDINSFLPPRRVTPTRVMRRPAPARAARPAEVPRENRLLNPVELINLTRMAFPGEPAVDEDGGLLFAGWSGARGRRRRGVRSLDMFPFALASGELR